MHRYAKQIGEMVKQHYCPEDMFYSSTAHEDLRELGEWVDIMKDLAAFDRDMRILEAMDDVEKTDVRVMSVEEIITHAKRAYDTADLNSRAVIKTELMKMVQAM